MADDKGAGVKEQMYSDVMTETQISRMSGYSDGYNAGRKAEREMNWKNVAELCGVNPHTYRPCIEKVEEKLWCPICKCADKIRGGQDEE